MGKDETIGFEEMITYDALMPKYDSPMSTNQLETILAEEDFVLEQLEVRFVSPVHATARKQTIY